MKRSIQGSAEVEVQGLFQGRAAFVFLAFAVLAFLVFAGCSGGGVGSEGGIPFANLDDYPQNDAEEVSIEANETHYYKFTHPKNDNIGINLVDLSTNMGYTLYSDSLLQDKIVEIDDYSDTTSERRNFDNQLTKGAVYYLVVKEKSGSAGQYSLYLAKRP